MIATRLLSLLGCMVAAVVSAAQPPAMPDAQPASSANTRVEPAAAGERMQSSQDASPAAQVTPAAATPAGEGRGGREAADRLDLDTTVVTGNRELPKVLYIVPWKKAEIGELPAQPFNTLLDEVLAPVDRDVFRREVTYYHAVSAGADASASASAPPAQPAGRSEK
jgi:hypothetical protein